MITNKMVEAGKEIASLLVNVSCEKSMGGLGGCKHFNINNYPIKYREIILEYLNNEIESVTAIYKAMDKEKNGF